MEITDIKSRLSIKTVLAHYGLRPDGHHRLLCPFHPDKTPSLQIYPQTNTYCCFSSNCRAGTGDVIQFIGLMEHCSKHEALVKAATLVQGAPVGAVAAPGPGSAVLSSSPSTEGALLAREAVLAKVFSYFKKALPLTPRAVAYLEGRALDYRVHEVGYNSGGLHVESPNHYLVKSMAHYGLLKPLAAKGYRVWAKQCIIFPLKNRDHKIVSLYGRSIGDSKDQRHFYLSGREGLYPGYPASATKRLILTESILDAASLLQQPAISASYGVLALYGTQGLTGEHLKAIGEVAELEELILILDADDAGAAATVKHAQTLKQLLPGVKITQVALPAGEDVNSVLQSHDDPKVLMDLVESRQAFFLSTETESTGTPLKHQDDDGQREKQSPQAITPTPPPVTNGKLDTRNPELLLYDSGELLIAVLGGIRITGLERMRVTLKIQRHDRVVLPVWHSLDLYHHTQREQAIQQLAEAFETGVGSMTTLVGGLTGALEAYRLEQIEALRPREEQKPVMSAAAREAALAELKHPELLKRTGRMIGETGIVGEETNRLIAYLAYGTRKQSVPLHVMFLGSSASGKTYLQERVSQLIPEEDILEITQITDNALYYFKRQELAHKLILIEDLDGAMSVLYPLRELQTKRKISKTVTLKDTRGNLKTITLTVEGPVSVSGCTTKEKLYEDNANRCILLYTDQSAGQDHRINAYQGQAAAGRISHDREDQYKELFKNMQRLLMAIRVVNPYAGQIRLPEQVFKPRRTMTLLLGFMEAVTFYHQYQREVKRDDAGQPYIETTVADIAAAFGLLRGVLFSKSDELTQAARVFLEQLKEMQHQEGWMSFNARAIRERLRIHPGTLKRYLAELVRYGYLKGSGNRYRNTYEYTICHPEEYEGLKSSVENHLQAILADIGKTSAAEQ